MKVIKKVKTSILGFYVWGVFGRGRKFQCQTVGGQQTTIEKLYLRVVLI